MDLDQPGLPNPLSSSNPTPSSFTAMYHISYVPTSPAFALITSGASLTIQLYHHHLFLALTPYHEKTLDLVPLRPNPTMFSITSRTTQLVLVLTFSHGVGWDIKNLFLYSSLEPYSKVQGYHTTLFSS